uniref:Prostaglandin-endoperoxide synthase n=1 Tax=Macrostomum lignano TaxID=282301 RepID=A0A1I8FBP7_9PLAT
DLREPRCTQRTTEVETGCASSFRARPDGAPSCCRWRARNSRAFPSASTYSCQTRRQNPRMSAAIRQLAIRSPICCPRVPAVARSIYLREAQTGSAGLLARLHPAGTTNEIFQTTKLILIGKTLKIVVEEYVQHLSNYHFKLWQYQNRIAAEFNLLYHWHPLMADDYRVAGTTPPTERRDVQRHQACWTHSSRELRGGLVKQHRRAPYTANNHPEPTVDRGQGGRPDGRDTLRLQSWRRGPLACALRSLYKDVDAVEFYPRAWWWSGTGRMRHGIFGTPWPARSCGDLPFGAALRASAW